MNLQNVIMRHMGIRRGVKSNKKALYKFRIAPTKIGYNRCKASGLWLV